jgi:peptidoglycan/xylan/chitin deacetylase (PgdA/CDA1 family)
MDHSWMRFAALSLVAAGLAATGCDPLPRHGLALLAPQSSVDRHMGLVANPIPLKRVSTRKANPTGRTLILEYHKLSRRNTELDRTPAKFKKDLETLYKEGYRPVTVSEWLDGKMHLAPGASPVILTFDDAHPSQLRFKKDGTIDPNCFVAIWQQFAVTHPDFPVHGTFFVLPPWPFGQAKYIQEKVKMLRESGSEIACHTYHHYDMAKLSDDKVMEEIATSLDWLEKDFGVTNVPLAFPYGNKPKNMELLKGFTWNGKEYHVRCSMVAAGNPAEQPTAKSFDNWKIPRVVVCEESGGSTQWLKVMLKSTKFAPYVAP